MGCIPQNQYNPLLHEIISVHNTEGECNEECGVCCINSICVDNNQTQCAAAGGIWYSGVSCEDVICPSPSPSPSHSITPSPSPSQSVTPSISITPSLSITPSPYLSPSPSLSIQPSIEPSASPAAGACCVPGCESDFANIGSCTGTPELIVCNYCEYFIDPNTENYYVDTNYKLVCSSGGYLSSGPWSGETQYGFCPANHTGGCFEGEYDCSSELIKGSGEFIDYYTDPTNVDSFISGGNPGSATSSDPCGGSYPCTKIKEAKTFSNIAVYKNPYGQDNFGETCEVNVYNSKVDVGIWDDSYLGGSAGLFTTECFVGCNNGDPNDIDLTIYYEMTAPGAYSNYIPDCCSGINNPSGTNKDKVFIFRVKGSLQKITIYNEGTHLSNQSVYGLDIDYICNDCNEGSYEASGVYVSEIHYAVSRQHDLTVYLCDPTAGSMIDITSYICDKNVPFFVPTLWDSIDWVNDEGYDYYNINNFSAITGTIWGMRPIGTPTGTTPLTTISSCQTRSPCATDGFTRNSQNPNDYCPPCDPFNGIVGNMKQSDGTLYVVHTATAVSGSFSPIGVATPLSTQFQEKPNIAGGANITYICIDSGYNANNCGNIGIWHPGESCTTLDCNA